jgi:catechol 2,3-dioxygenase-like lactoylglutathione lyase family enzyme
VLLRTDRIVIAASDLDRAQREMIDLLGRSPAWVGEYPADETDCVLFRLDNLCVELLAPRGDTPVCDGLRKQIESQGGGLYALHLECDDISTTTKAMREHGLQPSDPREGLARDEPSGAFRRFLESELDPAETAGIRIRIVEHISEPDELPPSLATLGEPAAVQAGDHVVIFTADPERAIDLYAEKLGIRLALDKTFEARRTRLLFFRLGGFTIEVGAPFRDATEEPVADDRLWGLAFRVDDIEAASARIAEAGLEVGEIRDGHKPGTRVCTVKNEPAGVATLLIEPG